MPSEWTVHSGITWGLKEVKSAGQVKWMAGFGHPLGVRGSEPKWLGTVDRAAYEIVPRRGRQPASAGHLGVLAELAPEAAQADAGPQNSGTDQC